MDEVLWCSITFVSQLHFARPVAKAQNLLEAVTDYLVWYAKDRSRVKYTPALQSAADVADRPSNVLTGLSCRMGESRRKLTTEEQASNSAIPDGREDFRRR